MSPPVNYASAALTQKKHVLPGQTDCVFTIRGNVALLTGMYPLKVVRDATSYYAEGFQFTDAYRRRKWDGKKHFFDQLHSTMPSGLVPLVVEKLKEYDAEGKVRVLDETLANCPAIGNKGFDLEGIEFGVGKFDYQLAAANAMVQGRRGVLKIATNGGKTEVAIAVTRHLALRTLFLVEKLGLLYQTQKRFAKRLGVPLESIGFVGDSKCSLGPWVTVATPTSLANRLEQPEIAAWLPGVQVLFADECHHVAADTFYDVVSRIPAYFRFGLSGTPLDRQDGADLRLLAQTGPVLYSVPNKLLVERGISVPPEVEMMKVETPMLPAKGMIWREVEKLGVIENVSLNNRVADKAVEHAKLGKQVLILVEKIKQGTNIQTYITGLAPRLSVLYLTGKEKGEDREKLLGEFMSGKYRVIIATPILDEGVDVPNIDVLILAAGGKAKIKLLQRVGRGLRLGVDKTRLLVIDFANFCHPWLIKHSLARLQTYKAEECFTIRTAA